MFHQRNSWHHAVLRSYEQKQGHELLIGSTESVFLRETKLSPSAFD